MKKVLFLLVFILSFLIPPLFSETTALDSVINFDITLKELSHSTPDFLDAVIASDKYLIVEGSVSSITVIERSENNLILDIHLINGEWINLDSVQVYKCIINISGKDWEPRFPERTPREISNDLILQNKQILVIGKVSDYIIENSDLIAVIDAEYIRNIQ